MIIKIIVTSTSQQQRGERFEETRVGRETGVIYEVCERAKLRDLSDVLISLFISDCVTSRWKTATRASRRLVRACVHAPTTRARLACVCVGRDGTRIRYGSHSANLDVQLSRNLNLRTSRQLQCFVRVLIWRSNFKYPKISYCDEWFLIIWDHRMDPGIRNLITVTNRR